MKPEQITDKKILEWLLERENPSVRYFTFTKLQGRTDSDEKVKEAKAAIMKTGIVPEILARQSEANCWDLPHRFYIGKYTGTVWQLIILAELGADGNNPKIRKACEFILENSQDPESYAFSVYKNAKTSGGRQGDIIPCLTGNLLFSLIKLGLTDDVRVRKGIEWICNYQRCDDAIAEAPSGFPYDKYPICWGKHTCHMGVVKVLKALSALPEDKRDKNVKDKINELAEYMLIHHIYRKSHNLKASSKPGWLKFGFPLMYQTDILEILDILVSLGYYATRMAEAIEILKKKQNEEKSWNLENTFNGKMGVTIETKGKPSKWITLKALNVLSKYY